MLDGVVFTGAVLVGAVFDDQSRKQRFADEIFLEGFL